MLHYHSDFSFWISHWMGKGFSFLFPSCRCDQLGEELEAERLEVEIWRSDYQQRRLCETGQAEWTGGGGLGKYQCFFADGVFRFMQARSKQCFLHLPQESFCSQPPPAGEVINLSMAWKMATRGHGGLSTVRQSKQPNSFPQRLKLYISKGQFQWITWIKMIMFCFLFSEILCFW